VIGSDGNYALLILTNYFHYYHNFMCKKSSIVILIVFCCLQTANNAVFASELNVDNNIKKMIELKTVALNGYEPIAIPKSFEPDYSCLTMGEMVAMIAGSVVGGAVADFVLRSAPFTVVGIATGAALGSLLYRFGW